MDNPYAIKTAFTVHEAAAAIHGITRLHRDDIPTIQSTCNELFRAIKAKPNELAAEVPQEATGWKDGQPTGFCPNYSRATIARPDLLAWCASRNIYPPLLFPELDAMTPRVDSMDAGSYHTPALGALHAAIRKFWSNYDPAHPPKSPEIVAWVMKEHGVSKTMAESIDRVIRPEAYRRGGNIKHS